MQAGMPAAAGKGFRAEGGSLVEMDEQVIAGIIQQLEELPQLPGKGVGQDQVCVLLGGHTTKIHKN